MRTPLAFGLTSLLAFMVAAGVACSDDDDDVFDEFDVARDCDDACDDWADCVGGGFDDQLCQQRCQTAADTGLISEARVEDCENCLDDANGRCVEDCSDICRTVVFDIPLVGGDVE